MIVLSAQLVHRMLAAFVVSSVVLIPMGVVWARRTSKSARICALYAASLALILALTIPINFADMPGFPGPFFDLQGYLRTFFSPLEIYQAVTGVGSSPERIANVALYIPAAWIGHMVVRRWWTPLIVGASLSFALELLQAMTQVRDGSVADFVSNCLGTAIGTAAALAFRAISNSRGRAVPPVQEVSPDHPSQAAIESTE